MLRNVTLTVLSLFLFSHCSQEKPDIRVVCETVPQGNYVIKWEIFPPMDGTVKIYESSQPDSFNLSSPIAETEISKGFKDIFFVQTTKRSYFKLVFNNNYSVITAERVIPMQCLFNFRDLGGYYTPKGQQTRWGKLYRSSSLSRATLEDAKGLNNLGIRTTIDFRTDRERHDFPPKYLTPQIYNFPLRGNPSTAFAFADRILSKKMKAGDVKVSAQDIFSFLLENNSDYFIKMFDILLDASNYPILVYDSFGSDRSAIASALILAAIDIDSDQIISDYMLTNEQKDFTSYLSNLTKENIFLQDPDVQETFTALLLVHKGTITYSFDKITKEYGTFDNYFTTELKLTAKKREKLKEIMLY